MLVDAVVSLADTSAKGACVPEHGWNVVVPLPVDAGAVERGAPTQILKVMS